MNSYLAITELRSFRLMACFAITLSCFATNVSAQSGTTSPIAGTGSWGYSGDGGPATSAQLNGPSGVAFDSSGNLYIADSANAAIREVTPGGTINTVNTGGVLQWPTEVAVDSSSNLFVLDYFTWTVYEISGGNATALNQSGSTTAVTGEAINPYAGLAVDSSGNVYTVDYGGWIDEYQPSTGNWVTIYGFSSPNAITIDTRNNIYVVDNCAISVIYAAGTIPNVSNPSPGNIYTVAGTSYACSYVGDGGPATGAQLNNPQSLAVDSAGNIFSLENTALRVVLTSGVIHTIAATGGTWSSLAANQGNVYIPVSTGQVVLKMTSAASAPYLDPPVGPTIYDSGYVYLHVSGTHTSDPGVEFSVPYGQGSTPASVASSLAALVSSTTGSPIAAQANGSTLTLTLTEPGSYAPYYNLFGISDYPSLFPEQNWAYPDWGPLDAGGVTYSAAYSYSIAQANGDGITSGYDPNGNVVGYTDSVNGTWSVAYDNLNRLTGASGPYLGYSNSYPWAWSYDDFGNRLLGQFSSAQYDSQNHLTHYGARNGSGMRSVQYDGAGNIVDDGVFSYIYDAEGKVCAQGQDNPPWSPHDWVQFLYDAADHRVAKGRISWASCDATTNGFVLTNQYILGPNGEQMTELTPATSGAPPTWVHTNAFAGGALLATYSNDGAGQHFRLTDWLGTTRVQATPAGAVEATFSSYPFGEYGTVKLGNSYPISSPAWFQTITATEQFFTGKERDPGSWDDKPGNDFFGARYYSSTMGRFLSPDWTMKANDPVPYSKLDNPQSLNLYSYVLNNPLTGIDPDGHVCFLGHGSTCNSWKKTIDGVPRGQTVNIVLNGITGFHFHPSLPSGAFNRFVSGVTTSNTVQVKNGHLWPGFLGGATGLPSLSQVRTSEKAISYAFSTGHQVATIGYSNGVAAQGALARYVMAQDESFSYSLSVEPNTRLGSLTDISNASALSQTVRASNDPVLNTVGIFGSASAGDVQSLSSSESFMTNTGSHNWSVNAAAAVRMNGGALLGQDQ